MPQPHRTAGRRLPIWGSAAVLSVAAHALALSAWWQWVHGDGPLSRARRHGAPLRVQLVAVTPQPPALMHRAALVPVLAMPRASPTTKAPGPSSAQAVLAMAPPAPVPTPASAPESAASSVTTTPTAPAASATPTPSPAAPTGGRFAGLFAPITTQALGRGHWGGAAPRQAENDATQAWRQQQAMAAAGQALRQRTEQWRQRLQSTEAMPLRAACELRMRLTAQTAEVTCQDATDQARLEQELGGISWVTRAPTNDLPSDVQCMHAEGKVADWVACR